ncbi:acylneuraminate cytidylyltransferase [Dulcicalothrix desertica PCC 7102]|uniref:Acylneuraminate cytidylyltransferase n=1 Tax=Dulcicalothrix desertica PCC 7102 TaxID=232991 RepID=A0A3S1AGE4_9CYAN|nr:acylneuraminate cytidylyltransferase family protein [Dulcicalothrix desertica]RUT00233.1 acylneuraminate cytidylyltransferase [Dulcicalothrix desertica PCC 7102]TWH55700.1 N-acylneuraminate cytidylyltransferase [Dulcicalothrix desertica PCC 7102]
MSIITIIPARGGSKGVPRKNVRLLGDKPLIAHSILDAKEAKLVDKVYVSTDDPEIAEVSSKYGAEIISRPDEIAGDTASSETALMHGVSEIEKKGIFPELIIFLQCTSPIRSGEDIDRAIEKIKKENADSLLSVTLSHRFLWEEVDGKAKSINYDYCHRPRRQDMKAQYVENGSIYIFKPWILKELGNRLGGKISLFPMIETASLEIDSVFDFEVAEFIVNKEVVSNAD